MILLTAWKNVWRNKGRSLVVITSITIGVFAGIFGGGLMVGTMDQRMDSALNDELAHAFSQRSRDIGHGYGATHAGSEARRAYFPHFFASFIHH